MLEWFKNAKSVDNPVAKVRAWRTRCGRYKIEESTILYGQDDGYPTFYRAMVNRDGRWQIVSRHRKRKPAVDQLEHLHEHGVLMPKKRKRRTTKRKQGKAENAKR